MSEHKWQPGDRCETNSGKPCRIAGYLNNGDLVWEYESAPGRWVIVWTSICGGNSDNRPKPPTRKVVQRLCVLGTTVSGERDWGHGQEVEFEITPDKIVGVRLVEDDK